MDIYHLAFIYNSPNLNGKNELLFCQHQLKPYLLVLTLNSAAAARGPEGLRLADLRSGSGVGADWCVAGNRRLILQLATPSLTRLLVAVRSQLCSGKEVR